MAARRKKKKGANGALKALSSLTTKASASCKSLWTARERSCREGKRETVQGTKGNYLLPLSEPASWGCCLSSTT